jgi:hypothetical protein
MFDRFIYSLLDTIVDWCTRFKEYKINKSLPKGMSANEWARQQKSLINKNDTD